VQIHTRSGIWTELDGANLTESNPSHPIHAAGYRFTAEETSRILGRNAQAFYGLELEPLVHATAEKPNRS